MKIIFATNNKHKLEEIRNIFGSRAEVLSLADIDCHDDIPETGNILEANAMEKAKYIADKYGMSVFADDTGLEVDALGGAPGVYSARYAGEGHDSEANMDKLLANLCGVENRQAQFRTVIALILKSNDGTTEEHLFEGIVKGNITEERRGGEGFGYDPIFKPEGYDDTFAQLGNDIKNKISHRARAVEKLYAFFNSL